MIGSSLGLSFVRPQYGLRRRSPTGLSSTLAPEARVSLATSAAYGVMASSDQVAPSACADGIAVARSPVFVVVQPWAWIPDAESCIASSGMPSRGIGLL